MEKAICKNKCGFEEEFEPCELGLTYFQADGTCPGCGADTVYENGQPTREIIEFKLTKDNEQ